MAASALIEGKLTKNLRVFLKKQIVKKELSDELAVSDAKLGGLIKDKLDIPVCRRNYIIKYNFAHSFNIFFF